MRTILLSKADESYLQKCATEHKFAYGIIIGQHAEADKYVIVHLAKNGEEEVELANTADEQGHNVPMGAEDIGDIDTQALTNQWISASKMIPGSFAVLGIFVCGTDDDVTGEKTFKSAKKLLYDVHNLLMQENNFSASIDDLDSADSLFLAYSTANKKAVCQIYTQATNGGSFAPMDCRFVEKPFEWYSFECSYELDDVFPILDATQKINIEQQFQKTIGEVKSNLLASEIFIQNETVDESLPLETYIKQVHGKNKPEQAIRATIYLPIRCQMGNANPIKVKEFNGTIRFSGVVSSRIWCNPRNLIGDVKRFVRNDILRSLAARIQVYCDGLTETNVSSDAIFISEPPRRIYFSLHPPSAEDVVNNACANVIQFSEYIFRGEAPTVAVAQAKQILDLDIGLENIVADLEGLPDDDAFSDMSSDAQTIVSHQPSNTTRDLTRTMYMLGIAVALLVLIVSILLHYLFHT